MEGFLTNKETAFEVVTLGENKGHYEAKKTFYLGIMGGLYVALAALGNLIANFTIKGGLGKIIGAAVFPTGLMLVVFVGGSLFTGDCLAFLALKKHTIEKWAFARNLMAVWCGNLVGATLISIVFYFAGSYNNPEFAEYILYI